LEKFYIVCGARGGRRVVAGAERTDAVEGDDATRNSTSWGGHRLIEG